MVPLHNNKRDWLVRRKSWPLAIPASKAQDAINELIDLIGRDWVEKEVDKYLTWRRNNSLDNAKFLFHREPDCNLLIPYFAVALDFLSGSFSEHEAPEKYQAIRDLGSLAGSIFYFEKYWRSIPDNIGENHVVNTLKNYHSCRGMLTELDTATHFVQCDVDSVIPYFMDPRESIDKTDILVTWNGEEIEVHCKSKIPGAGFLVPFDIFDYWAGCFLRDTEHYRRNWFLKFELVGDINLRKAKSLRQRFQQWLASGLTLDRVSVGEGVIVTSKSIGIPPNGLSKKDIDKLARKPRYRAFSARDGDSRGNYHAVSVFDVVIKKIPRPAQSLSKSIADIKRRLVGNRPVIATVHLYDPLDLSQLLSPRAQAFQYWLNTILSDNNGRKISALTLTCEETRQPLTGLIGVQQHPALTIENPNANRRIPQSLFQTYNSKREVP